MMGTNGLPTTPGIYDTRVKFWGEIDFNPYELDDGGQWWEFAEEYEYRQSVSDEDMLEWLPLEQRHAPVED